MSIIIFKNGKPSFVSRGGQYDGEKLPGDLDSWDVLSTDSNYILTSTYGLLSDRSTTLYHTYGPARAAINKQVDYAIGPGLVFRSQPDFNLIPWLRKKTAKDWGKAFQKIVHYYFQRFNFYEKQSVLFRGCLTLGDALLFFERENGELTDLIEYGGDQIDWNVQTEDITLGIKHDDKLRKKAIIKTDGKEIKYQDEAGNQNVVQYLNKELPRQLRGYPLVYALINLAKNDDRHWDATAQRAVMESILLGNFESESSNPRLQTQNMANANLKKKTGASVSERISRIGNAIKMGAGNIFQFRQGEKMNFSDLKTPSNTFPSYKEWMINYLGAATGTPSEVILSKYSTSYTAHRGALNDFQKTYMNKRMNYSRIVMYPVIREIAKDAILQGFIKAPGFFENDLIQRAYLQGNYLGPVPGVINPLQEINAASKSVENAFELRSDIASRFGNEWDNFIEEWGEEEKEYFEKDPENQAQIIQDQELNNAGNKNVDE